MSSLTQALVWLAVAAAAVIAVRALVSIAAKVAVLAVAGLVSTWLVLDGDTSVLWGWWETIVSYLPSAHRTS